MDSLFVLSHHARRTDREVHLVRDHPSLVVQSFTASGWNWVWPEHPPTDELNTAEGLKVEIKTMSSVPKMPAAIRRGCVVEPATL